VQEPERAPGRRGRLVQQRRRTLRAQPPEAGDDRVLRRHPRHRTQRVGEISARVGKGASRADQRLDPLPDLLERLVVGFRFAGNRAEHVAQAFLHVAPVSLGEPG
jgi:hypothetical protein